MKCRYCFAECERGNVCEWCRADDAADYAGVSHEEAKYEDAADRFRDEER